jgi:hypothetical protein
MKEAVELHMVYMSSNNDRHPVPKNFTSLHYPLSQQIEPSIGLHKNWSNFSFVCVCVCTYVRVLNFSL